MPNRQIITLLSSFAPMSSEMMFFLDTAILHKHVLQPKQALLQPNTNAAAAYFFYRGACKMLWRDNDNEEMIFGFCLSGELLVLGSAFFLLTLHEELYIEALEACEVYSFSKEQMEALQNNYRESNDMIAALVLRMNTKWGTLTRILMEREGLRYARFCEYFPELQKLNLFDKDLCSYLGISRRTLARCKVKWLKSK